MDGVYIKVAKSKREELNEIIKWWQNLTKMELEETKFQKIWFLNTADYFGQYWKWDKKQNKEVIALKEKGMFISKVQLGKGMEFPIIAKAVKNYFISNIPISTTISLHDNILDFCSYKKLKYGYECFQGEKEQQRVNRFYACKSGAYLYKTRYNEDKNKQEVSHILKDSPVIILNKLDNKPIKDRNINYSFYLYKAREIIYEIEKSKIVSTLF